MRLKRLEMVGFKSFAEKTRVEFEPGVTAIVGPNGCGKSNISDAIRWSLGEMSAKSLRSQQMLDVIFNGTANRPPQGMSEVALTFDNTSHQIPLDYTEVTVARRLFRSGESEYYINKTQCRLKDVRDLFLDTGVGNDGYYVMAQGKIEFILASKPEERRELFEEAAGVSKYKVRREEALRRLSKVEQDMLRLNDSLAIYKQQIDSLDSAVRKARQHQKLQEELRTLEIASLLQSHKTLQISCQEIQTRREKDTEQLNQLKKELAEQETSLTQERDKAEKLEEHVLELQKEVAQCESTWAKTEAELQASRERQTELKASQVRLQTEIDQGTGALEERRKVLAAISEEVTDLQKQYQEKNDKFKQQDQKAQSSQNSSTQLQRDLDKTKARLLELVRLISHHRNEIVRLTSLSVRHEEASKAKLRELEKVQARRSSLEQEIQKQEAQDRAAQERLDAVQKDLTALQEAQTKEAENLADLEQTLQSIRERLARLEAEKSSLERWLSQDPIQRASAAMRRKSLPGIYGPVRDLLKTSEPFQRLLDRALGDRALFFVADTLNDAQAAVRYLSDERQGWATFLILDRLAQSEAVLLLDPSPTSRSLAQAVECDAKFQPIISYLLGRTFYVGATLFEEGLLRGGADPLEDSFRASPEDLKRLGEELAALQETLATTATTRNELKASLANRETEKAPLLENQRKLEVDAQVQRENLQRLRDDQQMVQTEERLVQQEREECLQSITQAQQTLQQEEILLTTLESEEKTLQEGVQKKESDLQALRQNMQAHQALVSQLRLDAETTRERYLGKQREEEGAKREWMSLEERLKQNQTEFAENVTRLQQLSATQSEKTALLESLKNTRETENSGLIQAQKERQELQERLHGREQDLSARRDAVTEAQTRAQEDEFQARSIEQERERVIQALQSSYQLSVEEAQSHYVDLVPNPEELTRIKRRLESLGPVNLAAPEEHAQLQERYDFLLTQQQDLLKAKDDLHEAITKINATTREHFKETFNRVRENFQKLYQQLFRGGEADLILTDEHNLLETGIDIVAQPPGKKLQNIALLSGGEKALTAIALLFAFFMVKPSPFCLLDEVDAPLDEANVGRFLGMVKSFTEKTQFIVITHNKRSMEMANVLYGVTMAELGVSSLISVRLESQKPTEVVAA